MAFCPAKVSEVPDTPVEDCAPSSDLMAANKATRGAYPATRAERERIRTATGIPHGGLTVAWLNVANRKLYGHELEVLAIPFARFVDDYMGADYGAVLLGSYANLPAHYRRWDPAFGQKLNSGHAVYVQGSSPAGSRATGKLWWMDPLAPWDHKGEWIDVAAVRAYAWGIGQSGLVREGAWLTTTGGPHSGADMGLAFDILEPADGTVTVTGPKHAIIRLSDAAYLPIADGYRRHAFARVRLVAPLDAVAGDRRNGWLVTVPATDDAAFLLASDVTYSPAPPSDCTAQVTAAVAPVQAELNAAKARISAAKSALGS
jgi:hypothetical protein